MCSNYFYTVVETLLNATPLPVLSITITVIITTTAVLLYFFLKMLYFTWLRWVLVVACRLLVVACGVSDQGSHPGPLHWEHGVLATGPPGKFLQFFSH